MNETKGGTTKPQEPRRLHRLPDQGMVAGVAAGLAKYFNLDVTLMRLVFIISIFITSGLSIVVYFIAVLIIPTPEEESINVDSVGRKVDSFTKDIESSVGSSKARNWVGIVLIILGGWLLARTFVPSLVGIEWSLIIPVALIVIGLLFIVRGRK